jgi:2-C-methyl-D-erythritol 4-phosphate cytidylyltransferase/2-C-methyl-D-erythritol 2,4-cyclodiphosphate synthase
MSSLARCSTIAILLAGGEGTRSGGRKQFRKAAGRSVLRHAADGLVAVREIGGLIVVVPEDAVAATRRELASLGKPCEVVAGGTTRNQSSRNGVAALPARCRWVLIHDAARPFAPAAMIRRVLKAAKETGAALPAIAVSDSTIEYSQDGSLERYLPRERLGAVQTPQAFARDRIEEAFAASGRTDFTDDAGAVLRAGYPVAVVDGDVANLKITSSGQLARALRDLKGGRG